MDFATTSSTLLNVIMIKGTAVTLVIFGALTLGATNVNANLQSQVCHHFAGITIFNALS